MEEAEDNSIMEVTDNQEEDVEPVLGAAALVSSNNSSLSPLPVLRKTPPSKIPTVPKPNWASEKSSPATGQGDFITVKNQTNN